MHFFPDLFQKPEQKNAFRKNAFKKMYLQCIFNAFHMHSRCISNNALKKNTFLGQFFFAWVEVLKTKTMPRGGR